MMKLSLSKLFKKRTWLRSKQKEAKVTSKTSGSDKTNKVTIKVRFTDGDYSEITADTTNYQTMFDQLSKLTGFGLEDTYGCRFNTFESHKYNGCLYLFNNRFVKNNGHEMWTGFEDKQLGKYVNLQDGTQFTLGVYYDLHDRVIIKYHLVDETIPDGNDLIKKKYFTHKHLLQVKEMIKNDSSSEYIKNCQNRAVLYLDSPMRYN